MSTFGDDRLPSRFWAKVQVDDQSGCWVWTAYRNEDGYGRLGWEGNVRFAHRIAYLQLVGEIPPDLELDHLCRNRACANPSHLEAVTRRVNALRGIGLTAVHAAKTHCPQNHEYASGNILWESGRRRCKTCRRDRAALRRAARQAA